MDAYYESADGVSEYLLFHYGSAEEVMPWDFGPRFAVDFPVRLVEALTDFGSLPTDASALEVGCAVGRSSFELSRRCASVLGIDYSQAFVDAAAKVGTGDALPYTIRETGRRSRELVAKLPKGTAPEKVRFAQGDAMHLAPDLGSYDLVVAANLICRLVEPGRFLDRLPELVKPGGQFVLTTPLTWLEGLTPDADWIGGRIDDTNPAEALAQAIGPSFTLEHQADLPFVIREHARKFQFTVALGTRWRRVG